MESMHKEDARDMYSTKFYEGVWLRKDKGYIWKKL
jgi:hypothetical protein